MRLRQRGGGLGSAFLGWWDDGLVGLKDGCGLKNLVKKLMGLMEKLEDEDWS